MKGFSLLPPQASTSAQSVDALFWALMGLMVLFAVPIYLAILFFIVKYRNGKTADRSNPPRNNFPLEITWTLVPTFIGIGFFVWAAKLYVRNETPPADAMEIYVVGKQWMWKVQHPEGRREINELHVPLGRDVKLTMTSQDVIHDFFVPAFRLKQDVLPGRYTSLWFKATKTGTYHLFCAEYCGTNHARMTGWVQVMQPEEYARWLSEGDEQNSMTERGEMLFMQHGCSGCHGVNSTVRAPMLDGIYNHPVAIQTGSATTTIIADERYLRDSILLPSKEIAAGFADKMPSYANRLSEDDVLQIVAYLKHLSTQPELPQHPQAPNAGKNGNEAALNYTRSWAAKTTKPKVP